MVFLFLFMMGKVRYEPLPHNKPHPIVWCSYNAVNFSKFLEREVNLYSQQTPHISPSRARYGVSIVQTNSNLYSASVTRVLYAISCIEPCYNGTHSITSSLFMIKLTWHMFKGYCWWSVLLLSSVHSLTSNNDTSGYERSLSSLIWRIIVC